jgi:hypothetical protein
VLTAPGPASAFGSTSEGLQAAGYFQRPYSAGRLAADLVRMTVQG